MVGTSRASFNILGSIEAWFGGERVRLGGPKAERLLAALLLEAGRVVPVSRLVEAVWEENPPETAPHRVRKSVAELRERIPGGPALLLTDGPGYRIAVDDDQVDAVRFRSLLGRSREASARGDGQQAVELLQEALALWRGDVLAGEGGRVVQAAARSLDEQRTAALGELYALRLSLGGAAAIVSDLRDAVERDAYDENLRGLLMLALYRTGRQAEAIEEFGRVRELLAAELAVDPSPRLCRLHEAILRGDPELADSEGPAAAPAADSGLPRPTPATLPYDLEDFSGRAPELERILRLARCPSGHGPRIVAVDGMGGVGKSALVVRAGHLLADEYPDGHLYADLHGFTPAHQAEAPGQVLDVLLRCMGIPGDRIPEDLDGRMLTWRSVSADRRLLVILDNAANSAQVRPLLPASPGCLVLVTSRTRLRDLDGAEPLSLAPLTEDEGTALIAEVLGSAWASTESAAAAALVRACGGLPLALRIATARLRHRAHWDLAHLVDRLTEAATPLEELSSGERSVSANLQLSYVALRREHQRAFRLLGIHPGGDLDVRSAAALLGSSVLQAERTLELLLDVHLLQQHERGRYTFHDLVRNFAATLCTAQTAREDRAAVQRLLDYYVVAAEAAGDVLFPGRARYRLGRPETVPEPAGIDTADAALHWFRQVWRNLVAGVHTAEAEGFDQQAALLTRTLSAYLRLQDYYSESFAVGEVSVRAAKRLGVPGLLRLSLTNHALAYWAGGDYTEGIALLEEALAIAAANGDRPGEARCLTRLGLFHNAAGDPATALVRLKSALEVHRELSDLREEALTLTYATESSNMLCRHDEARWFAETALAIARQLGDVKSEVVSLLDLAGSCAGEDSWQACVDYLSTAEPLCERLGTPSLGRLAAARKALALQRLGETDQADAQIRLAVREGRERSNRREATIENIVGAALHGLGRRRESLEHHTRALGLAAGDRHGQAVALDGMSAALHSLGDAETSAVHRRAADRLFEQIGTQRCCRRRL